MTWKNPFNKPFDGKHNWVSIPDSKDWDIMGGLGKGNYTIDFWCKFSLWFNIKTKIRWWYLSNIYYPIRKLFGFKELDCTFHMKATIKMQMEEIVKDLTDEETRILYQILWNKVHDGEEFIGGND